MDSNDHSDQPYLTTGGEDELLPHLINAIRSADRVDFAVAFIQESGLRLLLNDLQDVLKNGCKIRIITGDYMGITDPKALQSLMNLADSLPNLQLKAYTCMRNESFHPKVYITHATYLDEERGEIFIGSSNISQSALTRGIEWNIHLGYASNPERFDEVCRRFDELFSSERAKILDAQWLHSYVEKRGAILDHWRETITEVHSPEPYPVQKEALQAIQEFRDSGKRAGLVVLATGVGKTWLAAFDVARVNPKRILFVAHREEILEQAKATFQTILPDKSCGLYTGRQKDNERDFLFASIQSIGRLTHLRRFKATDFSMIIVDEFHHASANQYRKLLSYFKPLWMMGLTATPKRADGKDILELCDNNLIYECSLPRAIGENILCPFRYYGIKDNIDYTSIPWRGTRFEEAELEKLVETNERALHNFNEWKEKKGQKTLAFCVSTRHADFMSDWFNKNGAPSVAVHSKSKISRRDAIDQLKQGLIKVIFSVDLFNEGLDVPAIDTVMMLRPTESPVLFLQQLGRGLRKDENKDHLVVLDFIGNHDSFLKRPRLLTGCLEDTASLICFLKNVKKDIPDPSIPDGCAINFDLTVIEDFLNRLTPGPRDYDNIYKIFKITRNRRPFASELMHSGMRDNVFGSELKDWFAYVAQMDDLTESEVGAYNECNLFFASLQQERMTRSYKMVMAESFFALSNNLSPVSLNDLAEQMGKRYLETSDWLRDIPESIIAEDSWPTSRAWVNIVKSQPVTYISKACFTLQNNELHLSAKIQAEHVETFVAMSLEIIQLNLDRYWSRSSSGELETREQNQEPPESLKYSRYLPFYRMKAAGGLFLEQNIANEVEWFDMKEKNCPKKLNDSHFVMQVIGHSMEPKIPNGSLCLFSKNIGGGKNNGIYIFELQDYHDPDSETGLTIKKYVSTKIPHPDYDSVHERITLMPINSLYEPIELNEEDHDRLTTVGKFIRVIDSDFND